MIRASGCMKKMYSFPLEACCGMTRLRASRTFLLAVVLSTAFFPRSDFDAIKCTQYTQASGGRRGNFSFSLYSNSQHFAWKPAHDTDLPDALLFSLLAPALKYPHLSRVVGKDWRTLGCFGLSSSSDPPFAIHKNVRDDRGSLPLLEYGSDHAAKHRFMCRKTC